MPDSFHHKGEQTRMELTIKGARGAQFKKY